MTPGSRQRYQHRLLPVSRAACRRVPLSLPGFLLLVVSSITAGFGTVPLDLPRAAGALPPPSTASQPSAASEASRPGAAPSGSASRRSLLARNGMVVSSDPAASQVGVDVL